MWLSLAGLGSVYMAMVASYGICCTLGFPFSPLHNFIPFLLMGLGKSGRPTKLMLDMLDILPFP